MRVKALLIGTFILFAITLGFSTKCTVDLQNGVYATCIDKTYTSAFSNENIYYGCSKEVESSWWYIDQCTATVVDPSNIIRADSGKIVAQYWSNDKDIVSACANHDGFICDVNPMDGFSMDTSLSSVGYCDSSEMNCVKCENGTEIAKFDGTWTKISGDGNHKCESGCPGTADICDEIEVNSWSGRQIGDTPFEAYCGAICGLDDKRCNVNFGAHPNCDKLKPNDVCNVDYCDSQNRLHDYNGNHNKDYVTCDDNCGCDDVVDSILCDTECGASQECDNLNIGFNIGNAGCDDNCIWHDCGLYRWNTATNLCFTSCDSNLQCWNNAVCDLVDGEKNTCIIDTINPEVTLILPEDSSIHNTETIAYSFSVTDNADPKLDCSYMLDGESVYIGEANEGEVTSGYITVNWQGWHDISVTCIDEAGNKDTSLTHQFLYDSKAPDYSNYKYEDITPTVDNTLIDGDVVLISAAWTDNFGIKRSELYSNKSGSFELESSYNYYNSPISVETNYLFDTTGYGDKTIAFYIRTVDIAGNWNTTTIQYVHVYKPQNNITVTLREDGGNIPNRFEFEGNAAANPNWIANDTGRTELLGDFVIEHTGIGTTIDTLFSLNQDLPYNIKAKLNNKSDPLTAVYIDTIPTKLPFCREMVPGQKCEVWFWLELPEATPPIIDPQSFNITIQSETI